MKTDSPQAEPTFAFLTVVEAPSAGMIGGLLVVNRRGRPVEFHCTAAVAASRAEEILFGPTLRPHYYCERLGRALVARLTVEPSLLVVHQLDCWPMADETTVSVALVDPQSTGGTEDSEPVERSAVACLDRVEPTRREEAQRLLDELTRYIDLAEPFERVAEAIREAGLLGGQANAEDGGEVTHDQAA